MRSCRPPPDLALTLPGSSFCPSPFRQFVLLENTASQWEFPRCEPEPTPGADAPLIVALVLVAAVAVILVSAFIVRKKHR